MLTLLLPPRRASDTFPSAPSPTSVKGETRHGAGAVAFLVWLNKRSTEQLAELSWTHGHRGILHPSHQTEAFSLRPQHLPEAPDLGSAPEPDPAAASALSAPRSHRPAAPALLILQDLKQEQTQQFPALSSSFLPTRTVKKTTYFAVSFYGNYSQGKTTHRAFPKHCITSIS